MNQRVITLLTALLALSGMCCFNADINSSTKTTGVMQTSNVTTQTLGISSPAFGHMDFIPEKYTCDGANVNPPLEIAGIPESTKTLALIVDDPDAPRGTWDHWVVWNIPVTHSIAENSAPGTAGINDFGNNNYGGPCPPSGIHRYYFKIFALDIRLDLPPTAEKSGLEKAMKGHVLSQGELIGRYKRP